MILTIVLTISFALSLLFRRYKYPDVIAQICAGLLLGIPILKNIFFSANNVVQVFSEIGIIFLLLLTGMEVNYKKLLNEKKEIIIVAVFSFIIPFTLGYICMILLGYSKTVAIIVGFALSLTAEGTKLKLLLDYNLIRTKIGEIIIGAGIADDFFEIIGLSFVLFNIIGTTVHWFKFPIEIIGFSIIMFILLKYLPRLLENIKRTTNEIEDFTLVIILGLMTAFIAQILDLGTIIGAFMGGIVVHKLFNTEEEEKTMLKDLKMITFGFIVPFFFVNIGLQFNYDKLFTDNLLFIVILGVAIIGKLIGSIIVSFFSDITLKQSMLIGWAMNSRGAVELIIVGIAKANNIIPDTIFNAIVLMTIITTMLFPLILKRTLKNNPDIMN